MDDLDDLDDLDDDDEVLELPGEHCACGYLHTGVVPPQLCLDCGDRAIARWRDEEKRALNLLPAYAADVERVLRETRDAQRKALRSRRGEPFSDADWELDKGGRRLARLRRAHRDELTRVGLDRWNELAGLVAHDRREVTRKTAKRMAKRGLGAAAMVELLHDGSVYYFQQPGRG
ncbi:hypothetical protein [Agromyces larvae]|uniref:Uncharacterized protein n=1 Tax=Agromyces larvae TaxID=2929802 RepID=A0ABY4BXY5_9MICO|nr:hypothetical protein [Agromyces larvae]UOE44055.1 hypothetical protein MTO99_18165 [Agromyces larvae]